MGIVAALGALLARASGRTRRWLGLAIALEVGARLAVVATAILFSVGGTVRVAVSATASALVYALLRIAQSSARISAQSDLYRESARSVLAGDVLGVPTDDVRRVVLDGTFHATVLVAQQLPAMAGDVVASVAVVPILVTAFAPRVLVVAAMAVAVTMLVAAAARSAAQRLEQRSADSHAAVLRTLLVAIEARVEIASRAAEAEHAGAFAAQLEEHGRLVRRSGLVSSMLGRAPLAAAALSVGLVVVLDQASRSAVEGAVLGQALVLAACLPPLRGAALGAFGMVRGLVFVRPFIALLGAPARDEPSGTRVALPAAVRGEGVGFAYASRGAAALCDLTFDWEPSAPLILTGPNGSGKSTLFRLLLGLRAPSAGRLTIGGEDLRAVDVKELRREIAYLPQRSYLGEEYDTVRSAMHLLAPKATDAEILAALGRVEVLEPLRRRDADPLAAVVGQLSAGQRQRVALARVLLHNARILLLDEPDANLDREGVAMVGRLIRELAGEGKMVATAAHTPELGLLGDTAVALPRLR